MTDTPFVASRETLEALCALEGISALHGSMILKEPLTEGVSAFLNLYRRRGTVMGQEKIPLLCAGKLGETPKEILYQILGLSKSEVGEKIIALLESDLQKWAKMQSYSSHEGEMTYLQTTSIGKHRSLLGPHPRYLTE